MRRFSQIAVATSLCSLAACTVQHDRLESEGSLLSVKAKGITVRSDKLGGSIELTELVIRPLPLASPCDVKAWIQTDDNGNGKIESSEKRYLYCGEGAFKEFKKQRIRLQSTGRTESAILVIEARDCTRKDATPERHMLSIDREGVHRLGRDRPRSFTLASGSRHSHYVEWLADVRGGAQLSVGDLVTRGGMLAGLAPSKKESFLGAAILVDNALVAILTGKQVAAARIPKLRGKIGNVRILTFDRTMHRCADFGVANARVN